MAGQEQFMKEIQELEKIGKANGNCLSMDEIRQFFSHMNLDEKQYDFICSYYESRNITIKDRVSKQEKGIPDEELEIKEDPLDAEMVSIYKKETGTMTRIPADQMERIARKLTEGDENARSLLIESNLAFAMEIAADYKGKGLPMSDLIQESNIGLMMAVNDYEPEMHGNFHDYAKSMICRQIETSLEEYNHSTRSAMKMAMRVNELNRIATSFAREYEREAKPQELAERMGISEDQVRELMKVSLDAIAVLDGSKIGS